MCAFYGANRRAEYPAYGSGPYLELVAASVRLARRDLTDPQYAEGAAEWLASPIVESFAECIGFGGHFGR